jgi:DNA polymerase-1
MRLENEIYTLSGEFFNINSPKQIQEVLFGKLGIKPLKKNKTGFSVDTEVLEEIAKEWDIADKILEYRSLSKLLSTYVENLLKLTTEQNNIIHTTYNQLGAATGRMSSNDPNLQNIPTGVGFPDAIKSCFIPEEDHIFLVADYSQIELRVLAWLSQDPHLLQVFENNEDIHTRTARFLFPDTVDISSEQRRIAKTVNF